MKITGGNNLRKHLTEIEKASNVFNELTISVTVDRTDPKSIDAARNAIEAQVDRAVEPYLHNSTVQKLVFMHKNLLFEKWGLAIKR